MASHPLQTSVLFFNQLPHLEIGYVLQYGYIGFSLILFASEFSGLIPAGLLMVAMGALARAGYFSFWLLLLLAVAATVFANIVMYSFARSIGNRESYRERIMKNRFTALVDRHMKTRPLLTIFVSRFVGIVSAPTTVLAGLSQVPRVSFMLAVAFGNAICCLVYLAAGYLLGAAWEADARTASHIVLGILVVIVIGYVFYYVLSRRKD